MAQKLAGKVAVVTGASKGIGAGIALKLAAEGAALVVNYASDKKGADRVVSEITGNGGKAIAVQANVAKPEDIRRLFAEAKKAFGRLDILVNNAGITSSGDGSPGAASLEAVRRTFDTNFFGTLAVTQAMLPLLKRSASARIVNLSSGLGSLAQIGDPNSELSAFRFIGYGASKAALNMLTVQLAAELKDSGIKVNSADPGYTATDLNQRRGRQTIPQGAAVAIRLALLPDDGPTGGFFAMSHPQPW